MNQCVPSWDVDDVTPSPSIPLRSRSNSNNAPDVTLVDYEVAELTWENGQIAMHGLGPPRVPTNNKHSLSNWDKPRAGGTLESIVNQATRPPPELKPTAADEVTPWFARNPSSAAPAPSSRHMNTDARVPCRGGGTVGSMTQVASCSGAAARVPVGSATGTSGTLATNRLNSFGAGEMDCGGAGSPDNDSSGKPSAKSAADDHDSVSHSRFQRESGDEDEDENKKKEKSSVSTKRSRAAAIHNQSERKRRDKINQRMKTLQKLVPNSSKTDKASMLDEVIEYLKQLQGQVQMMGRMNMPAAAAMMIPVAMQQQLQLSMMNPMGMGMGMGMGLGLGMGMDINPMACSNLAAGMPPMLHPNPFMPMASWDGATATTDGRLQPQLAATLQDPLSSFFSCQSQPITPEAYQRMAAMYQQLHQPPFSNSKS